MRLKAAAQDSNAFIGGLLSRTFSNRPLGSLFPSRIVGGSGGVLSARAYHVAT
jgi:hypothetical protein